MNKFKSRLFGLLVFIMFVSVPPYTPVYATGGAVNVNDKHQTMEGFGASIAWYANFVTNHINKDGLYNALFNNLGLDILRIRNSYRGPGGNFEPDISSIVAEMNNYSFYPMKVFISSWAPPAAIKSNGVVEGGNNATLKKDALGKYMYRDFARYWADALKAYQSIGVVPDYISIQNEPSYDASWESCRFDATESSSIAGYNKALDTVYAALQDEGLTPRIFGPEVHGIGYNTFQNYMSALHRDVLDGYCYHLYHGGSGQANSNPDAFNVNLAPIASAYNDKPIFQTEYDYGDWLNTAWLIHDCIVNGNVSGYFWWELIWPLNSGGNPLVQIENPWNSSSWTTPDGFILTRFYWAFRQYAYYIDPGWTRVTATTTVDSLRMSAFVSPDGTSLTLVVLNIGHTTKTMGPVIQGFTINYGTVVRTSDTEEGALINSNYDGQSDIEYPARSVTTISISGRATGITTPASVPEDYALGQNFPNPFNPSTSIRFTVPRSGNVELKVYDELGRAVRTLVNGPMSAGTHTVRFIGDNLSSGIYTYRLKAGSFLQTKKMVLIK